MEIDELHKKLDKIPILKRIESLDIYLQDFSLSDFLETIKLVPYTWYQSRVGKDDYWGIKIGWHENFNADAYFWLSGNLLHPELSKWKWLWHDGSYTSGSRMEKEIQKGGLLKEWEIARKFQGEIRANVEKKYSVNEQKINIETINKLKDTELDVLQKLFIYEVEFICINKYSHAICKDVTAGSKPWIENLNSKAMLGLIKKDFFKNAEISVMVDDKAITEIRNIYGKLVSQVNGRFERFSQEALREKLLNSNFEELILDMLLKIER